MSGGIRTLMYQPDPKNYYLKITLLYRISGRKLFQGFRGRKPLDIKMMADILFALGNLACACPEIEQIDINPLVVHLGKPVVVDATIIRRDC